ncbi:hypothetical protein F7734_03045 [Scytonema sp. UIC 10036]|uniref:hypothetical protein n=1 Tax=Scytonema sp. UIC 10036 TaxID=2304196 RepID=UPI0012DA9E8C|nr:hypothetical protein [Scytonema sp. UIC 10036]MUG91517.1 hypothetical protein [Scytonema sp. UIC 10036]
MTPRSQELIGDRTDEYDETFFLPTVVRRFHLLASGSSITQEFTISVTNVNESILATI